MATKKMSLKLLVDTKANKVLFAEAGKDFVDFLFGLLSLPVGYVVKLLKGRYSVGCFGNVYESFGNLDESYMQPNLDKDILLNPKGSAASVTNFPLLMASSHDDDSKIPKQYYTCNNNHPFITNERGFVCPSCSTNYYAGTMTRELKYVVSNKGGNAGPVAAKTTSSENIGYVQKLAIYMISDNLTVTPMSMVSGITMMNKCRVSKLEMLEERVVEVGMDVALELLRASFQTEATLTAVFLGNEGVNGKGKSCGAGTK